MLPIVLAAVLAAACPADPLLASPRLKVAPAGEKGYQHLIVSINVTNRGPLPQVIGTRQHLELLRDGQLVGSQPLPALGPATAYTATFRLRVPAQRRRAPLHVRFRYVLESGGDRAREDCDAGNDVLDATL